MSESSVKLIRKQIVNVVKSMMPTILQNELVSALHKVLADNINTQLKAINVKVDTALDEMNARSKDMQAYIVRNVELPKQNPTISAEQ